MQTEKISLINYRRVKFNFPKHVFFFVKYIYSFNKQTVQSL